MFIKTLLHYLNKSDRKYTFFLFMLILLTAFIELVGVGSLFPYIKILENPGYIDKNHLLKSIYYFFHFKDHQHFFIFMGCAIFFMILLKAAMSTFNNYFQSKLTYRINNRISKYCLDGFIRLPYEKSIDLNSSVLSKHLLVDVAGVSTVIQAVLLLLTDVILAITLVILMIFVDPFLILSVVLVLGGLLYTMNHLTKHRISHVSSANEYCNRHAYKTAMEALSSRKDAKICHVESYFVDRYLRWQYQLTRQMVEFNVISNLPTNILNVMGFGILLIILLYLLITRGNLFSILPIIALIAISIQRLLPTASRISTSIANIRRFKPLVYVMHDLIKALSKDSQNDIKTNKEFASFHFKNALTLTDVSYQYPNAKNKALDSVSLYIPKNMAFALVGESGAGKSTLVDILLGLLSINSGTIYCDDIDISNNAIFSLSHIIGYVPQQVSLLDTSIKENIAFGVPVKEIDEAALERAIDIAQLKQLMDTLPEGLNTHIGEKGAKLSGGQRQRVGIARALYRDPDILIMDEATNALDAATEREFNCALKALMSKKTLIIIAHRLSSVRLCDQIVQLEKGRVVASGSYEHLIQHSETFRKVFNLTDELVS